MSWDCSHPHGPRSCLECAALEVLDPRRTSFPQLQRFLLDPQPDLAGASAFAGAFSHQDAMTRLMKLNIFKISLRLFLLGQHFDVQFFVQDEGLYLSLALLTRSDEALDNKDLKQLISLLLLASQRDFSHQFSRLQSHSKIDVESANCAAQQLEQVLGGDTPKFSTDYVYEAVLWKNQLLQMYEQVYLYAVNGGYDSIFVNGSLCLKINVLSTLSKTQQIPFRAADQIILAQATAQICQARDDLSGNADIAYYFELLLSSLCTAYDERAELLDMLIEIEQNYDKNDVVKSHLSVALYNLTESRRYIRGIDFQHLSERHLHLHIADINVLEELLNQNGYPYQYALSALFYLVYSQDIPNYTYIARIIRSIAYINTEDAVDLIALVFSAVNAFQLRSLVQLAKTQLVTTTDEGILCSLFFCDTGLREKLNFEIINSLPARKQNSIAMFALFSNSAWTGCLAQTVVETSFCLAQVTETRLIFDYVAQADFVDDTNVIEFLLYAASGEHLSQIRPYWKWAMLCVVAQQAQPEPTAKLLQAFQDRESEWLGNAEHIRYTNYQLSLQSFCDDIPEQLAAYAVKMVLVLSFDDYSQHLSAIRHLSSANKLYDWILKFVAADTMQRLALLSNKFEVTSTIEYATLQKMVDLPSYFLSQRAALSEICQALQMQELGDQCQSHVQKMIYESKYLTSLQQIGLNMDVQAETSGAASYFGTLLGLCMCRLLTEMDENE